MQSTPLQNVNAEMLSDIFFCIDTWSTQPSIPLGYVNRVPACLTVVKAGCVHLCWVEGKTV